MNQREVSSLCWLPISAINELLIKAVLPLCIVCLCIMGCSRHSIAITHSDGIRRIEDLKPKVDQMVVLTGTYHDPGKGNRTLRCGFATFAITDYSLNTKTSDGFLVPEVKDGQRITVRARLRYFPGSQMLIEKEAMPQMAIERTETIDGQTYIINSSAYYITEASLIKHTGK